MQLRKLCVTAFSLGSCALLMQACSGKNSSSGISIPQLSPIVSASLPSGLKPGGSSIVTPSLMIERARLDRLDAPTIHVASITPDNTNGHLASGYLVNLFQNTFSSAAGFVQGYLMAQVATVDSRMSLFQGVQASGCLANSPTSVKLDLSAIDPILSFTLNNVQCYAPFGSGTSDAGEVFGQNGSNTSLWVQASSSVATTGTAGVSYANVRNAGSTSSSSPEQVDGVAMVFTPNTSGSVGGALGILRFIATPSTNTFEMYYGASGGVVATTTSTDLSFIGTGFRMISNGTLIYADGTLCTDPGGTTCNASNSNWQPFNTCLDASASLHTPASDCASLANSFTLNNTSASLTFQEITGDANVKDSYGLMSGAPGPTIANAALVLPICQIGTLSAVAGVSKYGP